MHVYHYAAYEITALRRLMGRYGTREAELDDLLRRGVFVDLLKVVRNGIRASRPGYGLKEMETFLDFERRAEIQEGGASIIAFEQWMQTHDDALLRQIDEYNREDCIATKLLRDWLLELRAEAIARVRAAAAAGAEGAAGDPAAQGRARRAPRRAARRGGGARGAAARLLRPRAQARLVGLLRPAREVRGRARRRRGVDRPARAHRRAGAASRARTRTRSRSRRRSTSSALDRTSPTRRRWAPTPARSSSSTATRARLVLKRGPSLDDVPLPDALIPKDVYGTNDQEDALQRIGRSLLAARPALSRGRVDPPPRAVRPRRAARRPHGARALARRPAPRHPGPARLGEDVDDRPA